MRNFDGSISSVLAAAALSSSGLPSLNVGPAVSALLSASTSGSRLWLWYEWCQVCQACPPARVTSLHAVPAVGVLRPLRVWVSSHTFAVLLLLIIVFGDNWRPTSVVFTQHWSISCMLWALVWCCALGCDEEGLEVLVGPAEVVEVCPQRY